MGTANAMAWDGGPGHYEVWYLTTTDPATGIGVWIRMTMRAPIAGAGSAECALWFLAMDRERVLAARKATFPISRMGHDADPFRLVVGDAVLTETGMTGHVADCAWDVTWTPRLAPAEPVHPLLRRAGIAKTIFVVPHPDLVLRGQVAFGGRVVELDGAKGGQAHLWGSEHARRWAWAHCNDLQALDGTPAPDSFFEAVSVHVARGGREVGPSTPVVARWRGEDLVLRSPRQVLRADARFGPTTYHVETEDRSRRLVAEVDAPRGSLVGVTYADPDGSPAYCYNSEVADLRLHLWERTGRGRFGWTLRETLVSPGRAHVEMAQREPIASLELHLT